MTYFNISNILSLCRAPLAFLFIPHIQWLRIVVVGLAAASDYFDGFLARRLQKTSRFGAVLDPVMDKLFTFVVVGCLVWEGSLAFLAGLAMLSRDIMLAAFLAYLGVARAWKKLRARSLWWGKVSTILQYLILLILVAGVAIPSLFFLIFPVLALLYLGELVLYYRQAQ